MAHKTVASLDAPRYVFQNITDWINQTNLGLGFADLYCHYEYKYNMYIRASPKIFVAYANRKLAANKQTSVLEINDLFKYHHPAYFSTPELKDYVFELDDDGNVDATDTNLLRLVQIRKAYVAAYNEKHKDQLPPFEVDDAIARIIPQTNFLYDSNKNRFNISEYLSAPITLKDDSNSYTSSLLNPGVFNHIVILMMKANNFSDTNIIPSVLLDRYFNGGSPDYLKGRDFKFYLDDNKTQLPVHRDKAHFTYPIFKNLDFTNPFSDKNVQTVIKTIRPDFPKLSVDFSTEINGNNDLTNLAKRYIATYMNQPKTNRKPTALEALNLLYEDGYELPYIPGIGLFWQDTRYLLYYYTIPEDKLSDISLEILDPIRKVKLIFSKLDAIRNFFNKLSDAYGDYSKESILEAKRLARNPAPKVSNLSKYVKPENRRSNRTSSFRSKQSSISKSEQLSSDDSEEEED